MGQTFRKDLSHVTWQEVYARQAQRAGLVAEWMDALGLGEGSRVLEAGAGPGFVSLILADRVGANGSVYAIDRSAAALSHLVRRQTERGISQIRTLVADVATLEGDGLHADSALVTMVLHHVEDPVVILRNLYRLLPPAARIVVSEFHPEGPCEKGAPQSVRIAPARAKAWCESAGFRVREYRRQDPEHYMLVAERAA